MSLKLYRLRKCRACICPGPMHAAFLSISFLRATAHRVVQSKKPSWALGVADRTAPSHTSTITRYVFERSTRSVDKRSSYLRELVWQPSWQLDTCRDRLNCASVYTVNCDLCTASAQRPVPTAGHARRPCTVVKYLTTLLGRRLRNENE